MPQYLIKYTFNGFGEVFVDADNAEQAEDMFFDGEFDDEKEDGTDYEISKVIEQ